MRQQKGSIVLGSQTANPGIKELNGLRPGRNLTVHIGGDGPHQMLHKRMPGSGVLIHEAFGFQILT